MKFSWAHLSITAELQLFRRVWIDFSSRAYKLSLNSTELRPPFLSLSFDKCFLWQLFADIAGCLLLQWLKTGLLCILRWSLGFREFSPSATLPTHCAKDNYMHSFADCIKIITMKDSENCTLQGEIRKSFWDRQCGPQSERNTITITCITCTQFNRTFDNKWPYYSISILSFSSSLFALMFSFGFCLYPSSLITASNTKSWQ